MDDETRGQPDEPTPAGVTAPIDLTKVKLLSGQRADLDGASLTPPDFTYRHIWNPMKGWQRLTLTGAPFRSGQNVFVSISEADPIVTSQDPVPKPMMGDARFSVHNVVPRNGEVEIRVHVDWPSPLLTQVSYLVVNP